MSKRKTKTNSNESIPTNEEEIKLGELKVKKEESGEINTTIDEDALDATQRNLTGVARYLFMIIAVVGALYHLYILNFNPIDPWVFRSTHLAFGTVLALMLYKGWKTKSNRVAIVDWILIAIAIFVAFYIYKNLEQIVF